MAGHMWCPNCWDKFPLYFRVCPECQVNLVDRRPGPAPTPNAELVPVFVSETRGLTEVARSLLESEKIEYLARGERIQDALGWGPFWTGYNYIVGPVEFWVCADDAEHARARLQGLGAPTPEGLAPLDNNA